MFERKLEELLKQNVKNFEAGRLKVFDANLALSFNINEAYLIKLVDTDIGVLQGSFVPAVDEAVRDVQRSGGNDITSVFIRAELVPRVLAAIDDRESEIRQNLEFLLFSVVKPSNWCLPSVLAHLSREVNKLKNYVKNRCDIQIGRLERQESQSRPADGQAQTAPKPAKATAEAPKGFDALGQKLTDLSRYFDDADLTERQRQCASMKYEYGLAVVEIARRQGIHRSTVQESLHAGNKRLKVDEKFKQALKRRAAHRGLHNESD
jgi:DNA-binding CsgD family transcriptional regulator